MIARMVARGSALALALMIGTITLASGQTSIEVEGYPFVGGTFFLSDPPGQFAIHRQDASRLIVRGGEFRDFFAVGMAAGIRIADDLAIEGMFSWVPTRLDAAQGLEAYGGDVDINYLMYSGSFLYHFPAFDRLRSFAGVGVGGETMSYESSLAWERHTDWMANFLVGANFAIGDSWGIRAEARDCLTRFESNVAGVDNKAANDLMLTAGLSYRVKVR